MSDTDKRTTREIIEQRIGWYERDITRLRGLLEKFPALSELKLDVSICGQYLDFDNLKHEEVIQVIKVLGGKWEKTPAANGKIDYAAQINGERFRCWRGEPPPSCRIVEEEVIVPAQPERREMRRKLVCIENETTEDGGLGVKYYPVANVKGGPPSTPEAA